MLKSNSTKPSHDRKPESTPDTRSEVSDKPERPEGSPLFWHKSGRWCKKIKGQFHYFGRGSHANALELYQQQADDLHAGRRPAESPEGLTVFQLVAKFLTAKQAKRDNGELTDRTFREYGQLCNRIVKVLGKSRLAADLRPDDFANAGELAAAWGPIRLRSQIVLARGVFGWGHKQLLLDKPAAFGESFNVPSEKTIRVHRSKQDLKLFGADEIRQCWPRPRHRSKP